MSDPSHHFTASSPSNVDDAPRDRFAERFFSLDRRAAVRLLFIVLLGAIVAAVFLLARNADRAALRDQFDHGALKRVGAALDAYASNNAGYMPPRLRVLVDQSLVQNDDIDGLLFPGASQVRTALPPNQPIVVRPGDAMYFANGRLNENRTPGFALRADGLTEVAD